MSKWNLGLSAVFVVGFAGILVAMSGCGGHGPATQPTSSLTPQQVQAAAMAEQTPPMPSAPSGQASQLDQKALPALVDFTASRGGFRTKYPGNWKQVQDTDVLNLVPADGNQPGKDTVDIDVPKIPFHLPGMVTLGAAADGYVNDGLKKDFQDVNVQSQTDQPFPDAKAKRFKATGKNKDGNRVIETVVAVRKDAVYIISSESDQAGAMAGRAAIDQILANWQWQ